jgi:hypothetical protein
MKEKRSRRAGLGQDLLSPLASSLDLGLFVNGLRLLVVRLRFGLPFGFRLSQGLPIRKVGTVLRLGQHFNAPLGTPGGAISI